MLFETTLFFLQKEEFQHTAYATNAYVTVGPFANQVLQGKGATLLESMLAYKHLKVLKLLVVLDVIADVTNLRKC